MYVWGLLYRGRAYIKRDLRSIAVTSADPEMKFKVTALECPAHADAENRKRCSPAARLHHRAADSRLLRMDFPGVREVARASSTKYVCNAHCHD